MRHGVFNGKNKALTFSFDDGNVDDIRLIEIMNKYGLKGTFNLNSGKMTHANFWRFSDVKDVYHINFTDCPDLYKGHEVACHSYTHPDLTKLDRNTVFNEIKTDKLLLDLMYNQNTEGFAYPFGTYNEEVASVLVECGLKYARTVNSTYSFELPNKPLVWNPTCHFMSEKTEELVQKFIELEDKEAVFYIWGHSYELVTEADWQRFEKICEKLAFKDDISYSTNIEIISCIADKDA